MTAAVATALLAAAAFLPRRRAGRERWRELTAVASPTTEQVGPLRARWLVVGVGAVGAVGWAIGGVRVALVACGLAALAAAGLRRVLEGGTAERTEPGAELASSWELLAACLEAGLPVAGAVLATATPLTGAAGSGMRRVAGLLELGADPVDAW